MTVTETLVFRGISLREPSTAGKHKLPAMESPIHQSHDGPALAEPTTDSHETGMLTTENEPIFPCAPAVRFKMIQWLIISEAALEITEQETFDEPRLAEAMARLFLIHIENFPAEKIPVGFTKDKLKYVSEGTIYTGISLWRKWKDIRAYVMNQCMPIWNKMEPFPSGTQVEDALKEVRVKLWDKKEEKRLHDRQVRDRKKVATAPPGSSPKPTGGSSVAVPMPEGWFPTEYMVFVTHGPPAKYFEGLLQSDIFTVNVSEEGDGGCCSAAAGSAAPPLPASKERKSRKRQRENANADAQYETRNDLLRRLVKEDANNKMNEQASINIDARAQQFAELQWALSIAPPAQREALVPVMLEWALPGGKIPTSLPCAIGAAPPPAAGAPALDTGTADEESDEESASEEESATDGVSPAKWSLSGEVPIAVPVPVPVPATPPQAAPATPATAPKATRARGKT